MDCRYTASVSCSPALASSTRNTIVAAVASKLPLIGFIKPTKVQRSAFELLAVAL
jgi:hypothetical protein